MRPPSSLVAELPRGLFDARGFWLLLAKPPKQCLSAFHVTVKEALGQSEHWAEPAGS